MNQKPILTEREVEAEFGINVHTLRKGRSQRRGIPFVNYGRKVFYRRKDIDRFLEECLVPTDNDLPVRMFARR